MSQATFNIQPVNRFGGQGTTIRRPRVGGALFIGYVNMLTIPETIRK